MGFVIDNIPVWNIVGYVWRVETTSRYEASAAEFVRTHPQQLIPLYNNLWHYNSQLEAAINYKAIEAEYLHNEADHTIMSLDQKPGAPGEEDIRLYVFPDAPKRILNLLAIGKVSDKKSDMEYCKEAVAGLTRV